MSDSCFHCGLPVPADADYPVRYREHTHRACCAGCQAVAHSIIESGLGDYYQHRQQQAGKVQALPEEWLERLKLYDQSDVQASFVRQENSEDSNADIREAALILEGITCAACIWLNEQHLKRLDGVLSVEINYSSHRARVRWNNRRLVLSDILQAISAIGYRAHPYDSERQEQLAQKNRKSAINRLWVAGLSMMQVMMYAVPVYIAQDGEIAFEYLWLLHWASFALTLPVVVYSAWPFYQGTWRDLKAKRVGMDTPVSIAVLVTFIASSYALLSRTEHGIYFDSVSMFVFLLLGGRYLEGMARRRAGAATESLVKLVPAFAHRLPEWPQPHSQETTVASLRIDDVVLVKAGETIPVDGIIVQGHSRLNEALLTGESQAIARQEGEAVIAGTLNLDSPLCIRTTHTGQNTRLAAIVRLLDHALAEKPRLAVLADRFAAWFISVLLVVAVLTFVWWWQRDAEQALWITVAVLVVSCPCALSLATPAALAAATGTLAQRGILIARGHTLETLPQITDVVFDKTGTLTYGTPQVLSQYLFSPDNDAIHRLVAGLEAQSEHPLAKALLQHVGAVEAATFLEVTNRVGSGLEGYSAEGDCLRLGTLSYISELCGPMPNTAWDAPAHATVVALGSQLQGWLAVYALGDEVRDDAAPMLQQLQQQGLQLHLLSGDRQSAVAALAEQLGISTWHAEATPERKLDYVAQLQQQQKRVLMVGDGVNDAPVLAKADVSLAMGNGTDVARASADMILPGEQLTALPAALHLARQTRQIVRQNLWWAVGYNLLALPLAVSGYLTPWLASLGMACSSLLVVGNALRLLQRKPR